jgi:predicted nucleotidyltransferase
MAHFAKLDENNIVLDVNVVNNDVLDPNNEEASGIAFLTEWSGGYTNWKQTSYNATFRKNYARVGDTYDEVHDAFIGPKEFESWVLNEEFCQWIAPVPYPSDGKYYRWDEETTSWIEV